MANHASIRSRKTRRIAYALGAGAALVALALTAALLLGGGTTAESPALSHVTVLELSAALGDASAPATLLDVREPHEYAAGHVAAAQLMPLADTVSLAAGLPKDSPVYVICRSGNRSLVAAEQLVEAGYHDVRNVTGGMIAWQSAGLPVTR